MKCSNCYCKLAHFYFNVAGLVLCKSCCLEIVSETWKYKVSLDRDSSKLNQTKS